ncbi:hypothetical protein DACRYDRAFT_106352 [Dacryopinax primogenitus]|uniref:Uncharacterized protein n=1 Tax=Dacryopinax primogenitus (strain DJM 731) TaxID=1858805 RepID=M5G4N6_DACPD|nr:uncharacterized protein DACRYDRAFT_106352 [Dacryopinax primogenitus]EJU03180.1 hypothetical protein DACRYDRAFT_106352 [Dacryopinax primogenitus]
MANGGLNDSARDFSRARWEPRAFPTEGDILGIALAERGRWLFTRTRREVHAWDLEGGEGVAAEWDLDAGQTVEEGQEMEMERVLQVEQDDGDILLHIPHMTGKHINSQILSFSPTTRKFDLLRALHTAQLPSATRTFSLSGSLVASEYETAITIWDWRKDEWITFTEDNFFDEPECPLHTSVQLHLAPPRVFAIWGGELKIFQLPALRPRRAQNKPAFLTLSPILKLALQLAPNANPCLGRIVSVEGIRGWDVALMYPLEGRYAFYFYAVRAHAVAPGVAAFTTLPLSVLGFALELDALSFSMHPLSNDPPLNKFFAQLHNDTPVPATLAVVPSKKGPYALFPVMGMVWLLHAGRNHTALLTCARLEEPVSADAEIVWDAKGRAVLLNRKKVTVLNML